MNKIDTLKLDITEENLNKAAKIVAEGGLVAFPTETVYGLGADALNAQAVGKVYAAKGRPSDNPMIVHISEFEELAELTPVITPVMHLLMEEFWPGPMTMVVPKMEGIPDTTTGGLDTVGVRMPSDRVARALIRKSCCPIAAPSANLSGKPSPTKAKHVVQDLDGRIDCILMGDDCQVGIESTVVDVTGPSPVILRPGIITPEQMEEALAVIGVKVSYDPSLFVMHKSDIDPAAAAKSNPDMANSDTGKSAKSNTDMANSAMSKADNCKSDSSSDANKPETEADFRPKAPGMKYKHYAPKAEMHIISGERDAVENKIKVLKEEYESMGKSVGTILFGQDGYKQAAHDFFGDLREFDDQNVDVILAGALNLDDSIGFAVMNRMFKSAGYSIIEV